MTFPASRTPISSQTPAADRTGQKVLDDYSLHISALWQASWLRLAGATGTNAVVATVTPPLPDGPGAGMHVTIVWPNTNTGAVTLDLGSGPHAVVTAAGETPAPGLLAAGMASALEFDGARYRLIAGTGGSGSGSAAPPPDRQVFTASGTWAKPEGFPDDASVLVRAWGAGGGGTASGNGNSGAGGGGGQFIEASFRLGDLPSGVAVSVGGGGAGGASGGAGGNGGASSFGSLLTALGGFGSSATSVPGTGASHTPAGETGIPGDIWSGAAGGTGVISGGKNAVIGGGGGAAADGSGGLSRLGGPGGASRGAPGQAPGGGGGGGHNGANGTPAGNGGDGRVEVIVG